MVRDDIHYHLYPVFVRFGAHIFEFLLGTELIISYCPVCGLILIVPFALAHELHTAVAADYDFVGRGCLHRSITRRGNIRHAFAYGVERPAPRVKYDTLRNSVGSRFRRIGCGFRA